MTTASKSSPATPHCWSCKKEIASDDQFCPHCGAKIIGKFASASKEDRAPSQKSLSKRVVYLVAAIGSLVVAAWLLLSQEKPSCSAAARTAAPLYMQEVANYYGGDLVDAHFARIVQVLGRDAAALFSLDEISTDYQSGNTTTCSATLRVHWTRDLESKARSVLDTDYAKGSSLPTGVRVEDVIEMMKQAKPTRRAYTIRKLDDGRIYVQILR
jgi:predicted RNA-binding Zn-ribbon protein involved in translation (DUF1610 family)